MSVVSILDCVTAWAQEAVCSKIKLKVPPDDETAATDESYDYELVNPAAFALFVPTKDKLPPLVRSPFPSICVRFGDGVDDLREGGRTISIDLFFSAWNPGTHGEDILVPTKGAPGAFHAMPRAEADAYFKRTSDGWRDVWNMVDIALREIESVTHINGLPIDRSVPVKFAPLSEQGAIPDYYPFWFAQISFSLRVPLWRNIREGVTEFL